MKGNKQKGRQKHKFKRNQDLNAATPQHDLHIKITTDISPIEILNPPMHLPPTKTSKVKEK